jgi:preprotein translocase subunit SecG
MKNILLYAQLGSAVLLIITILLQQRGQGMGSSISGGMEYSTKRGVEKGVFYATIVFAVLFIGVSVARLVLG